MPQDASSPSLLRGLCEAIPAPGPYLCSRWGEQVAMIRTTPEAAILIFVVAFLIGLALTRYHYKKRLEDTEIRLKLRDEQNDGLRTTNEKLEVNNEKLQSQLKTQTSAPSSSVFAIEPLKWRNLWREKGKTELYPLLESRIVPDDATLVLQVQTRIRAIPARAVEDVVLVIAGNRLHLPPYDWQSRSVDHCEQNFYFDIPPYIQLAYHKAQLIAECEGGVEERSLVFRILLTRTYAEGL